MWQWRVPIVVTFRFMHLATSRASSPRWVAVGLAGADGSVTVPKRGRDTQMGRISEGQDAVHDMKKAPGFAAPRLCPLTRSLFHLGLQVGDLR